MENDLVDLDELDKLIKEVSKNKKQKKTNKSNFDDLNDFNIDTPGRKKTNLDLEFELSNSKKSNSKNLTSPEAKCFPSCYATSAEIGISKHNKIR